MDHKVGATVIRCPARIGCRDHTQTGADKIQLGWRNITERNVVGIKIAIRGPISNRDGVRHDIVSVDPQRATIIGRRLRNRQGRLADDDARSTPVKCNCSVDRGRAVGGIAVRVTEYHLGCIRTGSAGLVANHIAGNQAHTHYKIVVARVVVADSGRTAKRQASAHAVGPEDP